MKTMKKLILLGLFLCAVISAPAVANINLPPGEDNTSQEWTFSTNPDGDNPWYQVTGIVADAGYTSPGTPTADVALTVGEAMWPVGWYNKLDESGHTGLIYGWTATIDLHIPNVIKPEPWYKIIQVEVTYHVTTYVPGQDGYIDASSYVTAGTDIYDSVDVKDLALGGGWRDVTITWSDIPQQYDAELIHLYFTDTGVTIDRIEVATVCVPEPATLLLLGGAGLVGLLRRRKAL